ncbi:MAG TPA: SDR family oxidoreductase, partial [bacterium]|nr:SDR family oxidoreductase [bacterium]
DMGRKSYLCGFDISDREMADAELKKLLAEVTPNILINNAGITADNLAMRMKPEEWERVININLSGAFWVTPALMRPLMKNGGCVVNIASVIGQMGNTGQANYAASKAGLIGMTKSLARELASKKVRVNAIAPGFIETAMTHAMPEEAKKSLMDIIPLKETGKPEDIANAALFLCSDMARYITGEVLKVNGGMYM